MHLGTWHGEPVSARAGGDATVAVHDDDVKNLGEFLGVLTQGSAERGMLVGWRAHGSLPPSPHVRFMYRYHQPAPKHRRYSR
jgi:hypothetical protein